MAWLITFNLINIAWVFFRGKEWDDAVKVLSGMFSLENVVLHPMFESKLSFLKSYGITFAGMFENISGSKFTVVAIIIALFLVVVFKNSMEKRDTFILNYKTLILTAIYLVGGILSLNKVSEFL